MEEARGIRAAIAVASSLGLEAAEAVVLSSSNRMAVRLLPCDILARIGPAPRRPTDELELDVARRLALSGSPVATLDPRVEPRVYAHSRFGITFWTYFETDDDAVTAPAAYADALARLHAGLRKLDIHTPHFTDRVSEAENVVSDSAASPELGDADRAFLLMALREVSAAVTERGAAEQLLHGEPHPGNLLPTNHGPLFIDFETCCRGPVEFDIAHAPEDVAAFYPDADNALIEQCRTLMLAMVTAWRWDRHDRFPNREYWREENLRQLRAALALA